MSGLNRKRVPSRSWVLQAIADAIANITGASIPAGVINDFAGTAAPDGWLLCDGSEVSRSTYADLFDAIGTTYGPGDGSTTFNLPDIRGRVTAGKDDMGENAAERLTSAGSGVDGTQLGATGGSELLSAHTHSIDHDHDSFTSGGQSANHTHNVDIDPPSTTSGGQSATHSHSQKDRIGSTGGGNVASGGVNGLINNSVSATDTGNASAGHTHTVNIASFSETTGNASAGHTHSINVPAISDTSGSTGTGNHGVVQPTIVFNKIIKV